MATDAAILMHCIVIGIAEAPRRRAIPVRPQKNNDSGFRSKHEVTIIQRVLSWK